MARLFVLDAMNLTYRAYHALITRDRDDPSKWGPLKSTGRYAPDGQPETTNAILGFANTVLKIRREEKPDYWVLAWDGPGPTFRHGLYTEYKATRKPMPDDLRSQIEPIERMAEALGLPIVQVPGMEADDVMATLACRGEKDGFDVVLVTGDKDLVQLVSEKVKVLAPLRRGDEYAWIDRNAVLEKWGVPPERLIDALALLGDTIDNVPGVPGIGEKTAHELLQSFGSLEGIYEHLDQVRKPSIRARLEANREQAFLSRELVTVKTDCELPYPWEQLRVRPIRLDDFQELVRRYELVALERRIREIAQAEERGDDPAAQVTGRRAARTSRLQSRLEVGRAPAPSIATEEDPEARLHELAERELEHVGSEEGETASDQPAGTLATPAAGGQAALDLWSAPALEISITTEEDLDQLAHRVEEVRSRAGAGLALLPVTVGEDPRRDPLVGLALAAHDGSTCYLPIGHEQGPRFTIDRVREWLGPAFADPAVPKIGFDLKRDLHVLERAGLPLEGLAFDVHIGSFLCDPERSHSLESLAQDFLNLALAPLVPEGSRGRARTTVASRGVAETAAAASAMAAVLHPLAEHLRAQLEARNQWSLYRELEHPLLHVLLDMERAGVQLDPAALREMSAHAGEEIDRLRATLHELAGEPVNLDSGPQVAKVLFEKLGLKSRGRTPGGALSTRQDVLEELAATHAFPKLLLEYRALVKLRSTYLDALPLAVDPVDGRVHTSYNQAGAATGRLSSSNPNLQNIPMRSPQGRAIRRAFVAGPGAVLVGADYSQIELRVMAHLSGDPRLIEAFESGEDVHASTARQIFGVHSDVLDPALRSRAKVVNFGVMYGMGARSLAQQMGIGLAEAQQFIRQYFQVFARVRDFLDTTLEEARRRGYVQTLLGRRRYLPQLHSASGVERSLAERAAINAPIQGSAADLMKLAMIRVHRSLKEHGGSARLLLQVHDELVLECPAVEAEAVSEQVRAEMEGCYALRVPLVVSVGRGATWFDVH